MMAYLLEYNRYMNIVGIGVILGIAWLFSHHRTKVSLKVLGNGLLLQFAIAFFALKTSVGQRFFEGISEGVKMLYIFAREGTNFVFGSLAGGVAPVGFVFAFGVLPIIIFFGSFMAVLFHLNILQAFVRGLSWLVRPIFGTSGAETLCSAANSFLGQTEAPLVVRNYLAHMTTSEMLLVMVGGMAHVSGSILVIYATMGVPTPHLLAASVMAIPASIIVSKILIPETEKPQTAHGVQVEIEKPSSTLLGAISHGAIDGMYLAFNVGAMLIAFLGLIALANALIGTLGNWLNMALLYSGSTMQLPVLNLSFVFSYLFAPVSYLLGFVGDQALAVGDLLGTKLVVNELIAYGKMVTLGFSERTAAIVTYALCGFANFSSIGIQIGGIGSLVPTKRELITRLGLTALLGGTLANLLSACTAALLL